MIVQCIGQYCSCAAMAHSHSVCPPKELVSSSPDCRALSKVASQLHFSFDTVGFPFPEYLAFVEIGIFFSTGSTSPLRVPAYTIIYSGALGRVLGAGR
jgi:hypothetical protein